MSSARTSKRVALLGAHTALAQNIVECADDLDLGLEWTRATISAHVGPGMVLIDPAILGDHAMFVVAFDDAIVPALLRGLEHHGASVIDLSGRSAELDVPVTFAGLGPPPAWPAWARVVPGPAHPVASAVASLAPLGVKRVHVVTCESAADADQMGIDELTEQVRAVFTMQDREPRLFPAPLAFNVIGVDAGRDAALIDTLAATQLEVDWSATRLQGPSYAAEVAVLDAQLSSSVELEAVRDHLEAGRALRVVDGPLSALDASGRDDVRIVGLRVRGPHIRVVLAYDRLRRGAATQAVWLLQSWRDRASK